MKILLMIVTASFLMTGCVNLNYTDIKANPENKTDKPLLENEDNKERIIQFVKDKGFELLVTDESPRLTEDGQGKEYTWLFESSGITLPDVYNRTILKEVNYTDNDNREFLRNGVYEKKIVSNDLKKILAITSWGSWLIYNVFSIESNNIIFRKDISTLGDPNSIATKIQIHFFSPSLMKAIYVNEEEKRTYLIDVMSGKESVLPGIEEMWLINSSIVFSEDEDRFAYVSEDDKMKKSIKIYDINAGKIIKELPIGGNNIYLSQWHLTDKVLYNLEEDAFYWDLNNNTTQLIGKCMFYPLLSPDSRFIACTKPEVFEYYEYMEFFPTEEKGLYVTDLINNETEKLTENINRDYIPMLWIK